MDFLPPKNDFVFKRLFGDVHNTDILLAFLNAVLVDTHEAPLKSIELVNPFLDKQREDDKLAVLDILVRSADQELVDLEIQVLNQRNMEKRTLFYWAELYARQMVKGKPYTSLHRAITINILDFAYLPTKQAHSLYQMRELLTNHLLSSDAEIHFFELPKLEKMAPATQTPLAWWGLFLRGIQANQAEVFRMYDPMMKKAVDVLEQLSQDEETHILFEARQKAIHDEVSRLEDAVALGKEEGEALGRIKGKEEGIVQSIRQLWRKRFGALGKKEEKALLAAGSEALEHILDQMLEPHYTVEQARADLGM